MEIREITDGKKRYLELLLLADEQESMVDRYLREGTMFVLEDGGIRGECVVTDEGGGILEIKNLAVATDSQGKGYGKALIEYVARRYAQSFSVLQVGTGDSPATLPFYEKCGFVRHHVIRDFFTDNYDHPIFDGGVLLRDMVILRRELVARPQSAPQEMPEQIARTTEMEKKMIDFNEKKGFICDMDGVIYHGNRVLPGVNEFIEWLKSNGKEYLFLTNNSGYTPRELKQKLARMGLDVSEEHFYTSALATAAFIKDQAPGCSAYVIGDSALLNALYDAGVTMNDVDPDYVIVGEGKTYSLDTLTRATNLVLAGAKLIGANSDISGPVEKGIAPACRALISPIEMATGKQAYFCGKPNPLMMRTGLKLLGCHSAESVMIGDRMDTDVISGLESGMTTVLVLSGISTRETLDRFAYRPNVVLDGVGDIVRAANGLL